MQIDPGSAMWGNVDLVVAGWGDMGIAPSSAATTEVVGRSRGRGDDRTRALATPSILQLASVTIVVAGVVLGTVALAVALHHRRTTASIVDETSSMVVDAQALYVALADADAGATTAFLEAGLEESGRRGRYDEALADAGEQVVAITRRSGLHASTAAAAETISVALPRYAGLVETARANNRLGYPVGAAYLRDASELMRTTILPAATSIYAQAAHDLDDDYRAGTSRVPLALVLALAVAVVAGLVAAQVFVARRTHRAVNPALAAATVLVAALGVGAVVVHAEQRDALDRSRRGGADPLLLASTSRILVLRTVSDESLDLVERGTAPEFIADFDVVVAELAGTGDGMGHIDRAVALADAAGSGTGPSIALAFDEYLASHDVVRAAAAARDYDEAVTLALGPRADIAERLDGFLAAEVFASRDRLDAAAGDARDALSPSLAGVAVATVVVCGLVVAGFRPRIREYR